MDVGQHDGATRGLGLLRLQVTLLCAQSLSPLPDYSLDMAVSQLNRRNEDKALKNGGATGQKEPTHQIGTLTFDSFFQG